MQIVFQISEEPEMRTREHVTFLVFNYIAKHEWKLLSDQIQNIYITIINFSIRHGSFFFPLPTPNTEQCHLLLFNNV